MCVLLSDVPALNTKFLNKKGISITDKCVLDIPRVS